MSDGVSDEDLKKLLGPESYDLAKGFLDNHNATWLAGYSAARAQAAELCEKRAAIYSGSATAGASMKGCCIILSREILAMQPTELKPS